MEGGKPTIVTNAEGVFQMLLHYLAVVHPCCRISFSHQGNLCPDTHRGPIASSVLSTEQDTCVLHGNMRLQPYEVFTSCN